MDAESRFVIGDLVTAPGYKVGRITSSQFTTAIALNKVLARVRLAGESIPRWFYRVRGGGFDDQEWLREETLQPYEY